MNIKVEINMTDFDRLIEQFRADMRELRSDLISNMDKNTNELRTEFKSQMDELKIELEATIETKIDKMRCDIVEMNSRMDDRLNLLTEYMDGKLVQINDKFDTNKRDTDAAIANVSADVADIKTNLDKAFGKEFAERVEHQMKPTIMAIRDDHVELMGTLDAVTEVMETLSKKETVTPREVHGYFRALEADIAELKDQQSMTQMEVLQAKRDVANLDRSLVKNVTDISERMDRIGENPGASVNHSVDPDEWYLQRTMGDETMEGFSLSKLQALSKDSPDKRKKKRAKDKKKRTKGSGNDDPGSSDSSSSSSDSSSSSSSSSSSDSSKKKRKDRKAKDILDPEKFKAGGRRSSIIGDEPAHRPGADRYYRDRSPSYLCIQPPPTTDSLYLDAVKIDRVLAFCKKFNSESARFVGGLQVSNYLSDHVRSQLKQLATKHDLPGKDGIIHGGVQTITNQEIFGLLSRMCAPKNLEAMQYELYQPCFPSKTGHDYTEAETIIKNIAEFKNDLLIYIDRFEDRLKLLGYTEKARKYLPSVLFKKGGAVGNPGLADFFIAGLPKPDFGLRVWASVEENKRLKCKDWETFVKLYTGAIEKIEKRETQKKVNKTIAVGVKELVKTDKAQRLAAKHAKEARKPQRLQAIPSQSMETVVSDGSDNGELPLSDLDDEMPSAIGHYDEDTEGDQEDYPEVEEQFMNRPNESQLQEMAKAYGTCYEMANTGKCNRPNCQYSHKPEDIEKLKKIRARKLAQSKGPNAKQVSFLKPQGSAPRKA